jgi:hypothetical protein
MLGTVVKVRRYRKWWNASQGEQNSWSVYRRARHTSVSAAALELQAPNLDEERETSESPPEKASAAEATEQAVAGMPPNKVELLRAEVGLLWWGPRVKPRPFGGTEHRGKCR